MHIVQHSTNYECRLNYFNFTSAAVHFRYLIFQYGASYTQYGASYTQYGASYTLYGASYTHQVWNMEFTDKGKFYKCSQHKNFGAQA